MRWKSLGKVENWWNNFPKIAPLFQSSTGKPSVGGEVELKVLVEKGRWCWCWCWWRWWSKVGGGVVGGKEVEAEIAETFFVHLLLQVVWGESQGTRSVKYRKTPSPNICLKRTAAKRRRTHKRKLRVISYQHFFNEYQPNTSKVGWKCK